MLNLEQILFIAGLLWLWIVPPLLVWYLVRQLRQDQTTREWEVVDLAAPSEPVPGTEGLSPSAQAAMRVIRERRVPAQDLSAPWDGQPQEAKSSIQFPEAWQWDWPDPPPRPAPLPDEERYEQR